MYNTESTGNRLEDGNDLVEDVQKINNQLNDIGALVKLLGRYAREQWVEVNALAHEVWDALPSEDATLRVEGSPTVLADREWLGLLFEKLFENAIAHAGTAAQIEVGVGNGRLYVVDNGPGVPHDGRDLVLESGYTSRPVGSGYGLTVVRHVTRAHEWGLRMREAAEGGTRFEFSGIVVD